MNILLKKLCIKQAEEKLNETAFANTLPGVSRQLWLKTKREEVPIGMSVIRAVLRKYDDLDSAVIAYLRDGKYEKARGQ